VFIRARKNEILIRFRRHRREIQIPPYWYAGTHLEVLPFREDLHGAGNAVMVDPVVAIPAATPVAHLHQPRPNFFRSPADGDLPRSVEDRFLLDVVYSQVYS
jgi:hypothetical protein